MADLKQGSIEVILEVDGVAVTLAHELFFATVIVEPGTFQAKDILKAYRKAVEQVEQTLLLYGFDGVVASLKDPA